MAQDQIKNPSGGNKPKPGTTSGGNGGQSAKDRSRAQSRPVSGKAPAGRSGKASANNKTGGNKPKPKPGGRPAATPAPRRVSGAMMAWGAVGLVVVIIVVLVVVKASSNSSNNTAYTPVTAAPASVVHDVTNIPESVYNTVGVNSPSVPVTPPTILSNQPPMTLDGKSPAMLYFGAEYCPYCAAERWSDLKITASSHTDVNPETHTFSFHGATLTSQYITFKGVEQYTNVPTSTPGAYTNLQNPTPQEKANILKYSSSKFNPNATSSGGVSFPYVNINNVALFSGASYSPGVLAGQTWDQIASGLSDPSNPATQAIVTTANYMSAAICASTDHAPASVCTSSGVKAAAKALKLG
jgi:thiol-disulfide isomerase/thioredoxin